MSYGILNLWKKIANSLIFRAFNIFQVYQYFTIYMYFLLKFEQFSWNLIQPSLKSGGTKDPFRQVKVPGIAPYWKAWIFLSFLCNTRGVPSFRKTLTIWKKIDLNALLCFSVSSDFSSGFFFQSNAIVFLKHKNFKGRWRKCFKNFKSEM